MKNHKRIKRILIILFVAIIGLSVLSYLTGYGIVIPLSGQKKLFLNEKAKPGDVIAVFSKFDFSKGDWKAYIVLSSDDFSDLNPAIPKRSCIKTTDRQLLQQMKKDWRFKVTEGDAGTVASDFYLFNNGELIYKSGIILLKNSQRLQNEEYGEMVPVNSTAIIESCKQFKRVKWPVVLL